MAFSASPEPRSLLGRYRLLSPNASVRVSPLCLGAMNIGTAWKDTMGAVDKEESFKLLDYFYDQGGNFIDTANNYQDEESETWLGEWIKKRNIREQIVIATKFSAGMKSNFEKYPIRVNYSGNSSKSLKVSVEASLKKLQTDYIDILYLHFWDYTTSIEELALSLNQLVVSGKVLYLGISDTPAWIVSQFNQYAKDHNLRPFSIYQGRWSAAERDFERDIIPMARSLGLALAPWGALGGGRFKTPKEIEERKAKGEFPGRIPPSGGPSENDKKVTAVLEKLANQLGGGFGVTQIALAYVRHKTVDVFPIVGGRTIQQLEANIRALGIKLSEEQIEEIDRAVEFNEGFPHNFLGGYEPGEMKFLKRSGIYDFPESRKPILPKTK